MISECSNIQLNIVPTCIFQSTETAGQGSRHLQVSLNHGKLDGRTDQAFHWCSQRESRETQGTA